MTNVNQSVSNGKVLYEVAYSNGNEEEYTSGQLHAILVGEQSSAPFPTAPPRANKKPRVAYKHDESNDEKEATVFDDESEEEEELFASRRRKTKVARRAILDESSDDEEEMQECQACGERKSKVCAAAPKETKESMEVDEPSTKNTKPSPAKKLKSAPTKSAPHASNVARRSSTTDPLLLQQQVRGDHS